MHGVVETGRLDSVSLFVRFDFTRDELWAAADKWRAAKRQRPVAKPEQLRTFVHELMHYLQAVTTPYGMFLQYCRLLQNRATVTLVNALLNAGCPVRLPLLYRLPAMPPAVVEEVERALSGWLNVENLLATLAGETGKRVDLYEAFGTDMDRIERGLYPLRPVLLPLWVTFAHVQDSLADLIATDNAAARERGNPVPMYPGNVDEAAISAALARFPTDWDRAIDRFEAGIALLGGADLAPFSVVGILESSATAAEYWESDVSYEAFAEWAKASVAPELYPYRAPLIDGLSAIGTRDLPAFLASFMTLCELALFGPVLPQHAGLRALSPGLEQLLPSQRFPRLLGAAANVEPMRDLYDYGRYVKSLSEYLGWIQPAQLYASAADGPHLVSAPEAFVYTQAQLWRAGATFAPFVGFDHFLFDSSPAAESWRDLFDFVIIDYKDRTTYHRNKSFLQSMTTHYLNMLGLEAVMLGDSLTLAAPYGNSPAENQWMTDWLRQRFASLFGRDFPDLQFV